MKNNQRINRIMEVFWLITASLTLISGAIGSVRTGLGNNYIFFILSAMAMIMYMLRRNLRISNTNKPG